MGDSFKTNLRGELDYQGLTVKELSAKTGIPKPTLDCYLGARQTIPPADVAVKIADALNVSVKYLVTGSDSKVIPHEYEKFIIYTSVLEDFAALTQENQRTLTIMLHALAESDKKHGVPDR